MAAQRQQHPPLKPEEREKLKERVINEVRAVLLPEKHGMLLENLNREYRNLIGERIPWIQMGYATLDDFVDQNPRLFKIQYKQEGPWVHVLATDKTLHIKNMVSAQNTKKRRVNAKPARRPARIPSWFPPTPAVSFGSNHHRVSALGGRPILNKYPRPPVRRNVMPHAACHGICVPSSKPSFSKAPALSGLLGMPSKPANINTAVHTRSFSSLVENPRSLFAQNLLNIANDRTPQNFKKNCPEVMAPKNILKSCTEVINPKKIHENCTDVMAKKNNHNRPPSLELPDEKLWDIFVTHVHSTINVCVRLLGDTTSSSFDELVVNMETHFATTIGMPSVLEPIVGKFYAVNIDEGWHRVEVSHVRGIDISCYFIDHGDEEALKATDLKELDNEFLTLAPQAKHVRLAGLEGFRDSASAIANLTSMALGRSLVGNVHTNDNDGISLVLWDTSGEDDDININETLLDKMKQNISGDDSNSLHSSMPSLDHSPNAKPVLLNGQSKANENGPTSTMPKTMIQHMDVSSTTGNPPDSQPARNLPGKQEPESYIFDLKELMNMDLSSFKPLSRAVLPDADDFFDVTITLAGSPSNFTVQPYFEGRYLDGLQVEMNKFYNNAENHYSKGPLTSDHLSKDFFFSGRHDDGQWYRVKVNSMLDEYTAAVKLVDYGDYCMMQLENMQPLWPQFRNLAMQAISASLAGIIATHGDWTPDDAVWFAQRVVNKQFVSKIKDVIWDMNDHDACGNGFKLSLSLFDTSNPNEDVVIEKNPC